MTQVLFTFVHPDGTPLADTEFMVQLRKAGVDPAGFSVVVPQDYTFVTNAQGTALLELQPSTTVYTMSIAREGEQCGGVRYKFYVPHSDKVINAEELYLAPPPNSEPWDETAIAKLGQAVQDVKEGAASAKVSATDAAGSATAANTSKVAAAGSAAASLASQQAAAVSATTASTKATEASNSAAAALVSKNAAATSATAAAGSATEANTSKNAAAASATAAANSATASEASKVASGNSATAAALSAAEAKAEKVAAGNSATAAAASASTATTQAGIATTQATTATTQANRAKTEADNAAAALGTKQNQNANLTALSAQTGLADSFAFFTGPGAMTTTPLTTQGRILIAQTTVAAMRTTLGLGTGAVTNVQTQQKAASGELLRADLNGIGMWRDLRSTLYMTGTPRDISGTGTTIGFGDAGVLGIPGYTTGTYGVLHSNVHFTDPSGAPAMSQTFEMHGETWRRVMLTLDSWNTWLLVGGRTQYISNADGEAWLRADGSMTAVANLDGGTFAISVPTYRTWNYPRVFVGTNPKVFVSMDRPSVDTTMVSARTAYPGLASVQMAHNQTANAGCSFVCMAIGRWKV